jgi:peptidoglycan-associated lipoprotein
MSTNNRLTLSLTALAVAAAAGCAHSAAAGPSATTEDITHNARANKQQLQATATPVAADASASDVQGQKDLQAAIDDLKGTQIFFGYDDDGITPEGRTKLATLGDILSRHPNLQIRVEGNCDERGTEAYNLVLGQRRADAARKYVMQMGARDNQVATISYGAERPMAMGHTEQAWKQNRRDDFVVVSGTN